MTPFAKGIDQRAYHFHVGLAPRGYTNSRIFMKMNVAIDEAGINPALGCEISQAIPFNIDEFKQLFLLLSFDIAQGKSPNRETFLCVLLPRGN